MHPADYHIHTPLCHHAEGLPTDHVEAARRGGLDEIGISEHAPSRALRDDWRMAEDDLPGYLEQVADAMVLADAGGGPVVRLGLECDWWEADREWLEELSAAAPWDYLIGSVHYVAAGWDVDNPAHISRIPEFGVEATWGVYWKACEAAVRSGLFDILGHADLVKKFGHRPEGDLRRYYEPVVVALAETGTALEINTAGWHKPCAEQYPAVGFLELSALAGVPLVISSDAHRPADVGRDFARAVEIARACGFRETARFERRARRMVPLDGGAPA